ncbi:helix-turn-helix transcriptional regulator [Sodalis-like endosymbiont of Proechinophthirus fluctus]|uniref:helix-turn-helix transcriptional regulator n=1 Tax=Sodalis-like endosymbiont of Proechinophthirus fluctus TaxID=1462730 RepID=UPI000A648A4D|nr:hypothetical protein [Sodalis-like endosymbiont of Proechinophthirus fluctus]
MHRTSNSTTVVLLSNSRIASAPEKSTVTAEKSLFSLIFSINIRSTIRITRECISSIFHARKVEDVSLQKQLCGKSPGYFLFYPPETIFTEGKLDVIFFVLQNMSSKVIGRHLGLSHCTVENKL